MDKAQDRDARGEQQFYSFLHTFYLLLSFSIRFLCQLACVLHNRDPNSSSSFIRQTLINSSSSSQSLTQEHTHRIPPNFFFAIPSVTMSTCDGCSCTDKSQCVKKGTTYTIDIVETEKSSYSNEVVDSAAAGQQNEECKCGPACACVDCQCGDI